MTDRAAQSENQTCNGCEDQSYCLTIAKTCIRSDGSVSFLPTDRAALLEQVARAAFELGYDYGVQRMQMGKTMPDKAEAWRQGKQFITLPPIGDAGTGRINNGV